MAATIAALVDTWRQAGPIVWAEDDYGWIEITGQPITLAPWQKAALSAWWQRREVVRTLALSNIKKTGKTLTNAVLTAWRWLALPGEHFCAANDLDQSASRQFAMISEMCQRNPFLRKHTKITGKQLTFIPTGSTLTALAVDAAGNSGANHLTASHTEAWGIEYEAGVRAWEELTPPPGFFYGLPPMRVCDSYAGFEGQSSTWHNLVDRGLAGELVSDEWPIYQAGGLLLFHIEGEEAQERCFRGTPEQAAAYYADEREAFAGRPGTFQRLHYNRRAIAESAFISPLLYDATTREGYTCPLPDRSIRLLGAIDAAVKNDNAALVTVYANSHLVYLGPHRIWKPAPIIELEAIEDYVLQLRREYRLEAVGYDPYQMEHVAQRLRKTGVRMIEFPQTVDRMTAAGSNLFDLFQQGRLVTYPAPGLREHVLNCAARETPRGLRLVKDNPRRKIDGAISLAMACTLVLETPPRGVFVG